MMCRYYIVYPYISCICKKPLKYVYLINVFLEHAQKSEIYVTITSIYYIIIYMFTAAAAYNIIYTTGIDPLVCAILSYYIHITYYVVLKKRIYPSKGLHRPRSSRAHRRVLHCTQNWNKKRFTVVVVVVVIQKDLCVIIRNVVYIHYIIIFTVYSTMSKI